MLLQYGADYNMGSMDATKDCFRRISAINEGNTPLMVACWNGRKEFVIKLLE
jgi:ankyrin repeat protein